MKPVTRQSGRHLLNGLIWVFLAEALVLPTGVVTAAFLTRKLGPQAYGLFTLATMVVGWIEWTVTSIFARATVKLVSETRDWQPVATVVMRLHLLASGSAALLLWLFAPLVASLLGESVLVSYLRLFAIDIPLFSLGQAQRDILVGMGDFRERALGRAARWIAKMALIILLVEVGLSVPGAILGSIGASLVQLALGRYYIPFFLFRRSNFSINYLWIYAAPLFLVSLTLRIYDKLDLFAFKILGGTTAQVGIYGAAQNLSVLPSILALSFSPLLLSSLSRLLNAGNGEAARKMCRNALRAIIALLPLAGLTAGSARELVGFVFGPKFLPTAPIFALLIFGAVAMVIIWVATAILTAASKPNWAFALTGPLVPLAIVGHLILIPRFGAIGASLVTTIFAGLGALATLLAVYRVMRVFPPIGTVCRSTLSCGLAYGLASFWSTPGVLVVLKFSVIGLVVLLTFAILGEFSAHEVTMARSAFRWQLPD